MIVLSKNFILYFTRLASVLFTIFMLLEGMKLIHLTPKQVEMDNDTDYCTFTTLSVLFSVSLAGIINSESLIQIGVA